MMVSEHCLGGDRLRVVPLDFRKGLARRVESASACLPDHVHENIMNDPCSGFHEKDIPTHLDHFVSRMDRQGGSQGVRRESLCDARRDRFAFGQVLTGARRQCFESRAWVGGVVCPDLVSVPHGKAYLCSKLDRNSAITVSTTSTTTSALSRCAAGRKKEEGERQAGGE